MISSFLHHSLAKICEIVNGNSDSAKEMKLPSYNQNMMGQLIHVALYLWILILAHLTNQRTSLCLCFWSSWYFNVTYAWKLWYSWCSWKYWWYSRRLIQEGYKVHKNILDVCQNIACVVRNGKIFPSIFLVWHLTSFLEGTKFGQLFSVMLYAYAVLSKESLTKMDPIARAVPPENLVHGRHV